MDNSPAYKLIPQNQCGNCCQIKRIGLDLFYAPMRWGGVGVYRWMCGQAPVALAAQTCDVLFGVQLSIFACIFAVYSILLAFLSDSYIKKLLNIWLAATVQATLKRVQGILNQFFFMYFVAIILSLILKLFLSCMPYDYILTQSDLANSIMAIALLFLSIILFRLELSTN